jgi:hypothetical protein
MTRARSARLVALSSALWLLACQNEDAYLGGSHEAYRCGTRCAVEQGAPVNAGDWFFNPDTELGDAPQVIYPLSGSAHPIDLRRLTVQFRRGRDDFQVFRVRVEAPDSGVVYDFFTPCLAIDGDGCRYLLEGGVWDNARADLVGKPAILTVTGSTSPRGVQRSSPRLPLQIVKSDLGNKGFYYWTTVPSYTPGVSSQTGIFRLPFGADQAEPFIMPNSKTNDRQCGACHSVSRDGSTIAFTARDTDGGPDQRSGSLVAKLTAQPATPLIEAKTPATYDSSMMALSYTGTRVLVAYDEQLVLRSSESNPLSRYKPGDVISSLTKDDLGGKAGYFPEFSPTDDAVVLTLSDKPDSAIAVQAGDIAVLDFDITTGTLGKPKIIVPGTDEIFHFYPTWSPDGKFIAFASAPTGTGDDGFPRKSYDQKKARLRLVAREGGQVYELTNATHQEDKWSTYPKFAPFSAGQEGSLMFLTFNSKINYGLVLDNDSKSTDAMRVAQLWMSAIDVRKLPDDPSSAPIWLPFQDATQPGHLGIWTNDVKCRTDLGGTGCDFGQVCDPGTKTCVVVPK